jgi:hypothetical protein
MHGYDGSILHLPPTWRTNVAHQRGGMVDMVASKAPDHMNTNISPIFVTTEISIAILPQQHVCDAQALITSGVHQGHHYR